MRRKQKSLQKPTLLEGGFEGFLAALKSIYKGHFNMGCAICQIEFGRCSHSHYGV